MRGEGTPAEYAARFGKTWYIRSAFYLQRPELIKPALLRQCADSAAAEQRIRKIIDEVRRGFQWKSPLRTVQIPLTAKAPVIDGEISGEEWRNALVLKGEVLLNQELAPRGNSIWRVMYDQSFLYVAAKFEDENIQINREHPYLGDSLELFLQGEAEMRSYWEIVVSPENDIFTGWHMPGKYGERCSRPGISPRDLKTAAVRTAKGFTVEIAFPFSALPSLSDRLPYPGAALHMMLCRTNRQADGKIAVSAPVPLLYGGHNTYGYINAVLTE